MHREINFIRESKDSVRQKAKIAARQKACVSALHFVSMFGVQRGLCRGDHDDRPFGKVKFVVSNSRLKNDKDRI